MDIRNCGLDSFQVRVVEEGVENRVKELKELSSSANVNYVSYAWSGLSLFIFLSLLAQIIFDCSDLSYYIIPTYVFFTMLPLVLGSIASAGLMICHALLPMEHEMIHRSMLDVMVGCRKRKFGENIYIYIASGIMYSNMLMLGYLGWYYVAAGFLSFTILMLFTRQYLVWQAVTYFSTISKDDITSSYIYKEREDENAQAS